MTIPKYFPKVQHLFCFGDNERKSKRGG